MSTALRPQSPPPSGLRSWAQGWPAVSYLVINLLTGLVALVLALCILLGAALVLVAGAGLLLLWPAMWGSWLFVRGELARIEAFTGRHIVPREAPPERGWLTALALTSAHRRAAAYTALHALWGLLTGTLVATILASCVAVLALPLYAARLPSGGVHLLGVVPMETPAAHVILWLVALAVLLALPWLARPMTQVDIQLARSLLGDDPEAEIAHLSQRVESLTASRTETVDSVEAERRRIERDLHDGPQQRLVAIAMDLGMARARLAHDPEGAGDLLDKAHAASKEAIVEMRHVARGITPPILADRGLDAAVSALAVRSAVPVTVQAAADVGRQDPTTEAIAYYCVSELLTNVAKHSLAEHARVVLAIDHDLHPPALVVEVTDDGVGGALPGRGTGLVGLRQRVSSVDGRMSVHSPEGGPTRVLIQIPIRPQETS